MFGKTFNEIDYSSEHSLTFQLGVGSIGTLVSFHLRSSLGPSSLHPISLILKKASPIASSSRSGLSESQHELAVETHGQRAVQRGFDVEIWSPNTHFDRKGKGKAITPISDADLDTEPNGPIHSLIVALKCPATLAAMSALKPRLSPSSVITLIQNGMGVYDELCDKLWPDPSTRPQFILGTTTHGVTRKGGRKKKNSTISSLPVLHKGTKGELKFAVVPDPRGEIDFDSWLFPDEAAKTPILAPPSSPYLPLPPFPSASPERSFLPLQHTLTALLSLSTLAPSVLPMPHLHHQLLLKLVLNANINPLTAVLACGPNGALFGSTPSHRLIRQLSRESAAVATAYLHSIARSEGTSPPSDLTMLFSPAGLEQRTLALIRATSDNQSSMAQDVSAGRETEVEYITGYLISLASQLGVPTPAHEMVREMVKAKTELMGLGKVTASRR